ncbi:hypothetical protein [Salipiger mucosus]|uniref:Deoxynucleotide monophosphate kinase n=1 Tax=Salipiger mucosus DSM 16094 TaxID=1123237 RepID=S9QV78_9RHOB|nr:hypothetical protein [Salipiger mucosus]EPX83508.1 hypothetical protein Salmuc_02116 [Salipiger mucosus DSM 16094]
MTETGEIVAINGLAGAGKSTAAGFFIDQGYVRVKMADTLKRMTALLLEEAGVPKDDVWRLIEGSQEDKLEPVPHLRGTTSRHIMRILGNEFRDLIYSDVWVDIACQKIGRLLGDGKRVVVDDIRYDHEIAYLRYMFEDRAQFLKIEAANHDELDFTEAHPSETPMEDGKFTHVLRNNGTIGQLHAALDRALWEGAAREAGARLTCDDLPVAESSFPASVSRLA